MSLFFFLGLILFKKDMAVFVIYFLEKDMAVFVPFFKATMPHPKAPLEAIQYN